MSFQTAVQKIWYPDHKWPMGQLLACCLILPAVLYGCLVRLRNGLYDRKWLKACRLPCPVISVGNITVGGTGENADRHHDRPNAGCTGMATGHSQAAAMGALPRSPVNIVSDGKSLLMTAVEAGDEPVLMARLLPGIPVLTGPQRKLTGEAAREKFGIDVLILDDAFQHRQIHRDINILLMDARRPAGNGRILPAGPLREPVSAVHRADIIVMTGGNKEALPLQTSAVSPSGTVMSQNIPLFRGLHRPLGFISGEKTDDVLPCDHIRGKRICAFAGIGSPEAFRNTLAGLGGHIVSFLAFPDHHHYTRQDVYAINEAAGRGAAELIVTTEKDGVKLDAYPDFKGAVLMLRIAMDIRSAENDFIATILARI